MKLYLLIISTVFGLAAFAGTTPPEFIGNTTLSTAWGYGFSKQINGKDSCAVAVEEAKAMAVNECLKISNHGDCKIRTDFNFATTIARNYQDGSCYVTSSALTYVSP